MFIYILCFSKHDCIIEKLQCPQTIIIILYSNLSLLELLYLMSWGAAYKTKLMRIQTKQNQCVRGIFFSHKRESAKIY